MSELSRESAFARRFSAYLAERFPVVPSALLATLYAGSAFAVAGTVAPWTTYAIAASFVFLFLLSLRLADEKKDYERDKLIHPDRLVQRGIIELGELRRVEVATVLLYLGLAALLSGKALLWAVGIFVYATLMRVEFFLGEGLEKRPFLYAFTHQAILVLVTAFLLTAAGVEPGHLTLPAMLWYQALALCGFFGFEIGRKLRAPEDEHPDAPTYSQVHGPKIAGAASFVLGTVAIASCARLGGTVLYSMLILVAPIAYYAIAPSKASAKLAEGGATLTLLAVHAAITVQLVRAWGLF